MIRVRKNKNKIVIDGHAKYADYGKDIVCASVSSIVITSINMILKFDEDAISYIDNNPFVITILKEDENVNKIIDNMLEMLESLAKDYPKNIKFL